MRRQRRGVKLLAGLFSFVLLAAACGGDDSDKAQGGTDSPGTSEANSDAVPEGGELVIGAEQEPDCMDWMGSCGGSSWGFWMVQVQTMPQVFDIVRDGDDYKYQPSSVVKGEPKLETTPKQRVTYEIADEAVWSDGTPITSADFEYTWDQVAHADAIYDRTGFDKVESVDASDPKVAVVTFKENYSDWKALFGGNYGIYPSHLLKGKDRNAEMINGYTFSAGPWKLDSWEKGATITLIPNENYWGPKPKLDKVIFKIQADTAAQFQAFKTSQVEMIYPQPQIDVVQAIEAGIGDAKSDFTPLTASYEALWLNESVEPFTSRAVRQAVAYGIDRDAIVKRLFSGVGVEEAMNVVNAPILKDYSDTESFSKYTRDLDKVKTLLEGDGWTKGGDGIYEKGGNKLTFTIKSTAGNKRRELTEQIVQQQLKEVGIDVQIENAKSGDLFGDILPKGDFQMALYAQNLTSLGSSTCNLFCSKNIPSEANNFSGQNWTRTNVTELDPPLLDLESNLDDESRMDSGKEADGMLAEEVPAIPLDPLPNIVLWSGDIVGDVVNHAIYGPFANMHEWGLKG